MNERLAKHYGIPNVYGSRFRKITFGEDQPRGGLLRQGSILLVTSYPTRTSPVIRGKWILDNVLGVPPPPPPPNVPALDDVKNVKKNAPVRERLAEHRKNATCAGCHRLMDPVGFALENYDAVGRWRTLDGGEPIDASGTMFNGAEFRGVAAFRRPSRPSEFVRDDAHRKLLYSRLAAAGVLRRPASAQIVRDTGAQTIALFHRHGMSTACLPYEDTSIMIIFKSLCHAHVPPRRWRGGRLPLLDARFHRYGARADAGER